MKNQTFSQIDRERRTAIAFYALSATCFFIAGGLFHYTIGLPGIFFLGLAFGLRWSYHTNLRCRRRRL